MASIQSGITITHGPTSPEGLVAGVAGQAMHLQDAGAGAGTLWAKVTGTGTRGWTKVSDPTLSSTLALYVSPSGGTGAGTITDPWSLAYALSGAGGRVLPGDTIWLRGGNYVGNTFTSTLTGAAGKPITVRQYPGERATILGNLFVTGSYSWFWGFEVGSAFAYGRANHVQNDAGLGNKFINLIVHDGTGQGIAGNSSAVGGEYYGCIVYNNGSVAGNDHGFYLHNAAGNPPLLCRDNIVFNNYAFNIQVYAETVGFLANITCDGNVCFNANGLTDLHGSDLLIDGVLASGIAFTNNYVYELLTSQEAVFWAVNGGTDIVITGNVLMGGDNKGLYLGPGGFLGEGRASTWVNARVQNNTIYVGSGGSGGIAVLVPTTTTGWIWDNNIIYRDPTVTAWARNLVNQTFAAWKAATGLGATDTATAAAPTGSLVVVRKNVYEAGRGHVIVYNWAGAASVTVDLSSILSAGQVYAVYNVQDYFGTPVASGTYGGELVTLPMAGIAPPVPVARTGTSVAPTTGPTFQAFVVRLPGS